ncbi:MAG: hypothetical protein ACK4IX_14010 [Candidatus Sericytochromatia bacterium]
MHPQPPPQQQQHYGYQQMNNYVHNQGYAQPQQYQQHNHNPIANIEIVYPDEILSPKDIPFCDELTTCKNKKTEHLNSSRHVCKDGDKCKNKDEKHRATNLHPCNDAQCKKDKDEDHIHSHIHVCRYGADCRYLKKNDIIHILLFTHTAPVVALNFTTKWPTTWIHSPPPSNIDTTKFQPHYLQVSLPSTSTEYTTVLGKFTSTGMVNNYKSITSIHRIENYTLWKWYNLKKEEISKKNNNNPNELSLFHGCPFNVSDLICTGGFDLRVASFGGVWGSGVYFSPQASISHGYAGANSSGVKRMFLSKVTVGDEFSSSGDRSLRKPPIKPNSNDHYDTVVASSNKWAYIVYENNQSYPEYMITYQ